MTLIALYCLMALATAVYYAWANRGAAPIAPDPVGAGLLLGTIWPITWTIWSLEFVVASLAKLIATITDRSPR